MKAHDGTETDAAVIEEDVARAFREYDVDGVTQVPATINLFTLLSLMRRRTRHINPWCEILSNDNISHQWMLDNLPMI